MSIAGLALLVAAVLVAVMSLAWAIQRLTGNSGWVDVAWSFGTGIAGGLFALVPRDGGTPGWRQLAVAGLVAAWSLRLGLHIALRAADGIDDPRYAALRPCGPAALRVEWGAAYQWRLYVFLMIQALVAFGLAVSIGWGESSRGDQRGVPPAAFGTKARACRGLAAGGALALP